LLNLKSLRPLDEFFLYDSRNSPSNTTVVLTTEKFKYEQMRDYLKKNFYDDFPMNKLRLVTLFGKFYYEQMTDKEFDEKWP
jgi:hypothetical protein